MIFEERERERERERLFTSLRAVQTTSREAVSRSLVLCAVAAKAMVFSVRARIGRRLDARRLPHNSVAIIHGAPAVGGNCDGCGRQLLPRQLVMSVPFKQSFVHLHAECFVAWNVVRLSSGRHQN